MLWPVYLLEQIVPVKIYKSMLAGAFHKWPEYGWSIPSIHSLIYLMLIKGL